LTRSSLGCDLTFADTMAYLERRRPCLAARGASKKSLQNL
jgi:hypothetical protein